MNNYFAKMIYIYLFIGFMWALCIKFPFGVLLDEMKNGVNYYVKIMSVTDVMVDRQGLIKFCFLGVKENQQNANFAPVKYSFIYYDNNEFLNSSEDQTRYMQGMNGITLAGLPYDSVKEGCLEGSGSDKPIDILRPEASPRIALNPSEYIDELMLENIAEPVVVEIPEVVVGNGYEYLNSKNIYLIRRDKVNSVVWVGFNSKVIKVNVTVVERLSAFFKDMFLYPIAIIKFSGIS